MKKILILLTFLLFSNLNSFAGSCSCDPFWENIGGSLMGYRVSYSWWNDGVGCCASGGVILMDTGCKKSGLGTGAEVQVPEILSILVI